MSPGCSKCGGEQEEGVLADTTYHRTFLTGRQAIPAEWIRGHRSSLPRPSKMTKPLGLDPFLPAKAEARPVVALRCTGCGAVELFAP